MADLLEKLHADAGLNLLRADLGLSVYDGKVPEDANGRSPDPPYALVYVVVEWPKDGVGTSTAATQVTVTATFYCHCVGLTAEAARVVGMRVRAVLLGVRPVITGRNCGLIKQIETVPPQRDESTGRLLMDAVGVYSFTTTG